MSEQEVPTEAETATPAEPTLVDRFVGEYTENMQEVKRSAEHTATEGWQSLYCEHCAQLRDEHRRLGKSLGAMATTLEEGVLTEDGEKSVKEIVKDHAAARARSAAFETQVIDEIVAPVRKCGKIITDYRNKADREERDNPLHSSGVILAMREAIANQPKPKWDKEAGTVQVSYPD